MPDPGTTQFWRVRELGGMELLESSFLDPAYPRHMHATYTIGVVDFGTVISQGKDGTSVLPAGSIYAFNPGDVHSGHAAGSRPISHRTFYPSSEALARFAGDVGLAGTPALPHTVLNDGPSAAGLRRLHRVLASSDDALERSSSVLEILGGFLVRYAGLRRRPFPGGREPRAVRDVKAYLDAHFRHNVTLDELAGLAGLSHAYLIRVFKKSVGLPPYSYLLARRVEEARRLLQSGMSVTQTALEVGFNDQSHLHRHFTRLMAVPPGRYARSHYRPRQHP